MTRPPRASMHHQSKPPKTVATCVATKSLATRRNRGYLSGYQPEPCVAVRAPVRAAITAQVHVHPKRQDASLAVTGDNSLLPACPHTAFLSVLDDCRQMCFESGYEVNVVHCT